MNGLRPRQIKAIADISDAYRNGYNAPVLVASTGFGKTHTSAEIIRRAVARGKTVWFLAHLKEILEETSKKLVAEKLQHGFISAGHNRTKYSIQVVSVQTVIRRLDELQRPDLIIVDESHLAVAKTYQDVFAWAHAGPKHYRSGGARLLHLTATPERLDGRGMSEVADIIVPTCGTQDLIDEGLLTPIKYYAPTTVDLSRVRTIAGDYAKNDLAALMDKPTIVGDAVSHWHKLAKGRPTIAFCCSIAHAEHVAAQFRQTGVRAIAVSGETDSDERRKALADLKDGRVDVVTNCALWVAGVDAPNVSCVILLSPTKSLTKYLQSVGRGMRTSPGKENLIVLDHGGMFLMHGLPTETRDWSLDGIERHKKAANDNEPTVKQCSKCYAVFTPAPACPQCGHVEEVKARKIEVTDGTLSEITEAQAAAMKLERKREIGQARTIEALEEVAKRRGYKPGWARFIMKSRQSKGMQL